MIIDDDEQSQTATSPSSPVSERTPLKAAAVVSESRPEDSQPAPPSYAAVVAGTAPPLGPQAHYHPQQHQPFHGHAGPPPQPPPPPHQYHPTNSVGQPPRGRSPFRRFIKAWLVAVLVLFLWGVFIDTVEILIEHRSQKHNGNPPKAPERPERSKRQARTLEWHPFRMFNPTSSWLIRTWNVSIVTTAPDDCPCRKNSTSPSTSTASSTSTELFTATYGTPLPLPTMTFPAPPSMPRIPGKGRLPKTRLPKLPNREKGRGLPIRYPPPTRQSVSDDIPIEVDEDEAAEVVEAPEPRDFGCPD